MSEVLVSRFVDVSDWLTKLDGSYSKAKRAGWEFLHILRNGVDQFGRTDHAKADLYQLAAQQIGIAPTTLQDYASTMRKPSTATAIGLDLEMGHAVAVLGLDDEVAISVLTDAAENGLSVQATRRLAWDYKNPSLDGKISGLSTNIAGPQVGATGQQSIYKTYDQGIDDSVDESQYDFDKPREQRYTIIDEYGIEQTVIVGADEELKVVPVDDPDNRPSVDGATAYNNHAVSDTPGYDGDEWYTPQEYIEAARRTMGDIDLDPATCYAAQETVRAKNFYTKEDDSLRDDCEWHGRVWLNPPYSAIPIKRFVAKLIQEFDAGNIDEAIIITNNSSDTGWFHSLLDRFPVCFTRGRVGFWRPDHDDFGARQGQTLFYLGDYEQRFVEEFSAFGRVVKAL